MYKEEKRAEIAVHMREHPEASYKELQAKFGVSLTVITAVRKQFNIARSRGTAAPAFWASREKLKTI